jgi:hypothetical protein
MFLNLSRPVWENVMTFFQYPGRVFGISYKDIYSLLEGYSKLDTTSSGKRQGKLGKMSCAVETGILRGFTLSLFVSIIAWAFQFYLSK